MHLMPIFAPLRYICSNKICNMKLRILLLLLSGAALFSSCTKNTTPPAYTYTFVNPSTTALNLVLYNSQTDYINNAHPALTFKLAPNASIQVPSSKFAAYASYWFDVYSDDYTFTNWTFPVEQIEQNSNYFTPSAQSNLLKLPTYIDYSRLVCINGGDTATHWTAVGGRRFLQDEPSDTGTLWNQLNPTQQNVKISMSKNHLLTLYYTAPYAPSYGSNILNIPWEVRADSARYLGNPNAGHLYIKSTYDRDFHLYGNISYKIIKDESGNPKSSDTLVLNMALEDPTFFQGTFYMVKDQNN